jgi:hypothetical protein
MKTIAFIFFLQTVTVFAADTINLPSNASPVGFVKGDYISFINEGANRSTIYKTNLKNNSTLKLLKLSTEVDRVKIQSDYLFIATKRKVIGRNRGGGDYYEETVNFKRFDLLKKIEIDLEAPFFYHNGSSDFTILSDSMIAVLHRESVINPNYPYPSDSFFIIDFDKRKSTQISIHHHFPHYTSDNNLIHAVNDGINSYIMVTTPSGDGSDYIYTLNRSSLQMMEVPNVRFYNFLRDASLPQYNISVYRKDEYKVISVDGYGNPSYKTIKSIFLRSNSHYKSSYFAPDSDSDQYSFKNDLPFEDGWVLDEVKKGLWIRFPYRQGCISELNYYNLDPNITEDKVFPIASLKVMDCNSDGIKREIKKLGLTPSGSPYIVYQDTNELIVLQ